MAAKKVIEENGDTKYIKVIIEHSNPEVETVSGFVGGNNVIENGKRVLKHYRFQLGKEIELPTTFVDDLRNRSMVTKGTNGLKKIKIYNITTV